MYGVYVIMSSIIKVTIKRIGLILMLSLFVSNAFADDIININPNSRTGTFSERYGNQSQFAAQNRSYNDKEAQQYGVSYGMGQINAGAGNTITSLVKNSRAKLGFFLDSDNKLAGEGDVLLPLYDGKKSVAFLQTGARSMPDDRWIVNAGLGQRLILSDDWLVGYNTFLDQDITRDHTRGGVGLEAWHKFIRFSSNYYVPLSKWRESKDIDGYEERAARGWDLRTKGYLPFYQKVAVTGSFTQWYGNNVAVFNKDTLEKDPKIWSYGLEYAPIPLVTTSVAQKHSEQGQSDTEVGLFFTYDFSKSWDAMTSLDMPNREKSIMDSRFDFVDRENKIILNYRKIPVMEIGFIYLTADTNIINNGQSDDITLHLGGLSNPAGQPVVWEIVEGFSLATLTNISPTTDVSGQNTVRLVANATGNGDVVIKATLGGMSVFTTIKVGTPPPTFDLVANPSSILVNDNSIITLTLSSDITVAKTVTWEIVSGSATMVLQETTTNTSTGEAKFEITGTVMGTVRVKATIDGVEEFIDVEVLGVKSASLGSDLDTIGIGESLNLEFILSGINPLLGNSVTWTTDGASTGTGSFSNQVNSTDATGLASATFTGLTAGTVKFVVTSAGISTTYNITIVNQATATLVAISSSIDVNGQTRVVFTYGGVADIEGKIVTWSVDNGTIGTLSGGINASPTNSLGQASDYLNGVNTGTVIVTATCEGLVVTTPIEVGRNTKANLSVDKNSINFGEPDIVATLQVSAVTPLGGRSVTWSVTGNATIDTALNSTDSTGKAIVNITPTDGGEIVVTATVDGVVSSQTINVIRTPLLSLNSTSTSVDLYSQVSVDLILSNIAIPSGKTISWEIVSGNSVAQFVGGSSTTSGTTSGGGLGNIVINTLDDGSFVLKASIAEIPGLEQYITIAVINNATASLIANPNTVLINQTSDLSFSLSGLGNTAVRNIVWTVVNDSGNNCTLNAGSVTDALGNANGTFTCSIPGMYEIKVSGEEKSISTFVNVIEQMSLSISSPQSIINIGDSLDINALVSGLVNPSAKTIAWSIDDLTVVTQGASTTINSSGNSTQTITAINPGTATITAVVDGVSVNILITVMENAAATLTSDKSTMIVRDTANLTFNLSGLLDISGENVSWSIVSGTGTLGSATTITDSNGMATNTIIGTSAGALQIRATSNGVSADFIIDIYETALVVLNASPIYIQENAITNLNVLLSGVSSLSGQTITWTNLTGYGNITNAELTTDSNGQGTAEFSSDTAGTYKIEAEINGLSDFITIEVSALPKDATLIASPIAPYVGDNFEMILTLTGGGSLNNKTVNWSIVGGNGSATIQSPSTTITDIGGNSTLELNATQSGDVRIKAEVVGIEDVEYTVTILDRMFLHLTADKDNLILDEVVTFTLNLSGTGVVDGQNVVWTSSNAGITSIEGSESITNNGGIAILKLKATASGITTITATVNGTLIASYTVNIIERPTVSLVANSTTILSGNATDIHLQISHASILDTNNVSWSIDSGSGFANLTNIEASTSGGGKAKATLNATAPGTVVVKTTTTVAGYTIDNYVTITILADYSITLSAGKTTINLGETLLIDFALFGGSGGSDLDGKIVTWSVSDGTKAIFVGGNTSTTAGGGLSLKNILASSNLLKVGTITVTATTQGKTASININIVDFLTTTLTSSSTSIDYGTNSILTLALFDTNVLGSRDVTWSVESGGSFGELTPINITTLANGTAVATVKGIGVGTIRIKASVGGVDKFIDIIVNNSITTSLTATNYTVLTGTSTNLTFTLGNLNGMPVNNLAVVWEIDSSSTGTGTLTTLTGTTNALGVATNTFNGLLHGTVKIKATITAFGKSSIVSINVINSPVINITAPKSTIYVGENLALTTNIISGVDNLVQNITWAVESGTGVLTPVTSQTSVLGKAVANLSSTTAGTVNVSATILGVKTYYTVNIVAQPFLTLTAPKYSIIKNEPLSVIMTLSGIPSISGKTVVWSVVSGTGSITTSANITSLSGTAVAIVTSNTIGSFTVQADVEGVTKTVVIDVIEVPIVNLISLRGIVLTGGYTTLTANLSGVAIVFGQDVTWEIVSGTTVAHFANTQRTTDLNGNATIRLYADTPGTVRIKVTINGVSAFVNVVVRSSARVTISSEAYNLPYNEKTTITAILSNYSQLEGQDILWEVISGASYININGKDATTNSYGSGNFTIHNKTESDQTVTIKVTIAGVSDVITINLVYND